MPPLWVAVFISKKERDAIRSEWQRKAPCHSEGVREDDRGIYPAGRLPTRRSRPTGEPVHGDCRSIEGVSHILSLTSE